MQRQGDVAVEAGFVCSQRLWLRTAISCGTLRAFVRDIWV